MEVGVPGRKGAGGRFISEGCAGKDVVKDGEGVFDNAGLFGMGGKGARKGCLFAQNGSEGPGMVDPGETGMVS